MLMWLGKRFHLAWHDHYRQNYLSHGPWGPCRPLGCHHLVYSNMISECVMHCGIWEFRWCNLWNTHDLIKMSFQHCKSHSFNMALLGKYYTSDCHILRYYKIQISRARKGTSSHHGQALRQLLADNLMFSQRHCDRWLGHHQQLPSGPIVTVTMHG